MFVFHSARIARIAANKSGCPEGILISQLLLLENTQIYIYLQHNRSPLVKTLLESTISYENGIVVLIVSDKLQLQIKCLSSCDDTSSFSQACPDDIQLLTVFCKCIVGPFLIGQMTYDYCRRIRFNRFTRMYMYHINTLATIEKYLALLFSQLASVICKLIVHFSVIHRSY